MNLNILKTVLLSLFFVQISLAQETIRPLHGGDMCPLPNKPGKLYMKDTTNTLDKYFGTWEFNDGTHYLKITFFKKERRRFANTRIYNDELVCEYQYKLYEVEKYNTYGVNSDVSTYLANHIHGSIILEENKIQLRYGEPLTINCARYKSGDLTLEFIAGSPNQLIWTRVYDARFGDNNTCADGSTMDMTDFLIPANIILTKIN